MLFILLSSDIGSLCFISLNVFNCFIVCLIKILRFVIFFVLVILVLVNCFCLCLLGGMCSFEFLIKRFLVIVNLWFVIILLLGLMIL